MERREKNTYLLLCTGSLWEGQAALPAALARLVMHNVWWFLETNTEIRLLRNDHISIYFFLIKLGILDNLLPTQLWLVCVHLRIQLLIR